MYAIPRSIYYHEIAIIGHTIASYLFAWDTILESSIYSEDVGPIWFLLALFWARIFFYGLSRTGKWLLPLCVLLSVSIILVHPYLPMPFGFGRGIEALVFMAIGYAYRKWNVHNWLKIVAIMCWPLSMWLGKIDMWSYTYHCIPIDILGACGGTLVIYFISKGLERTFVRSFFAWCGENSLIIFCAHSIEHNLTLIHKAVSMLPFQIPSMAYYGFKHSLAMLGAWVYIRYKSVLKTAKKG